MRNEITALDLQKQGNVVRLEKLSAEKIQLEEERDAAGGAAAGICGECEGGEAERADAARHGGGAPAAAAGNPAGTGARGPGAGPGCCEQQADKRSRLNVLEQLEADARRLQRRRAGRAQTVAARARLAGGPDPRAGSIRDGHRNGAGPSPATGADRAAGVGAPDPGGPQREQGRARERGAAGVHAQTAHAEPASEANAQPEPGGRRGRTQRRAAARDGGGGERAFGPPADGAAAGHDADRARSGRGHRRLARDATAHFITSRWAASCSAGTAFTPAAAATGTATAKRRPRSWAARTRSPNCSRHWHKLQEQVAEISRRKGALQSEQTELQAGLQQAQTELREQEVAIATHEGEFNALQNSQRLLHQKIDTVVYEIQSLAAQEQEGLQKRAGLAAQADECEAREQAGQAQVDGADRRAGELCASSATRPTPPDREQGGAGDRRADVRLLPAAAAVAGAAHARAGPGDRAAARRSCPRSSARKEQAESEIQESRGADRELQHDREQVNAQTAELVAQKQTQEAEIAAREEALARAAPAPDRACRSSAAPSRSSWRRRTWRCRTCASGSSRNTTSTSTTSAASASPSPLRTKARREVHALTPEEMAAAGAATDWDAVAAAGRGAAAAHRRDGAGEPGGHRGIRGNRAALPVPEQAARRPGPGQGAVARSHQPHQHPDAGDVPRDLRADPRQLPGDVHRGVRRRQSGPGPDGRERRAGKRHRHRGAPAGQAAADASRCCPAASRP